MDSRGEKEPEREERKMIPLSSTARVPSLGRFRAMLAGSGRTIADCL